MAFSEVEAAAEASMLLAAGGTVTVQCLYLVSVKRNTPCHIIHVAGDHVM